MKLNKLVFPVELKNRFNSFIVTAFDDSMTVEMQMRVIMKWLKEEMSIINDLIDYLKEFDEKFEEKLEQIVLDTLNEWYANGKFDDIFNNIETSFNLKLEEFKQEMINRFNQFELDMDNKLKHYNRLFKPHQMLDLQKVDFSLKATFDDSKHFIQGFSINQEKNELYVCRKVNTENYNYISVYNLETQEHISTKKFETTVSAFNEGLPYFYNHENQLCFLVRTQYERTVAIFNYDLNTLGEPFNLDGGSKINIDRQHRYLITSFGDASHTFGCYIYDYQSCIDKQPKLIKVVRFDMSIAYGEKVQSIGILDDKIVLCHGKEYPAITTLTFNGSIVESYEFSLPSLKEMISAYDDCLTDQMVYENEGCYPYVDVDGKEYLMVAHVFEGVGRAFFTNCGEVDGLLIKRKTYSQDVRNEIKWLPLEEHLVNASVYGADVPPQYAVLNNGNIMLRGVVTYTKETEPSGTVYYENKHLFNLPHPIIVRQPAFYKTVAGGSPNNTNRLKVHSQDNVARVTLESTTDSSTKPFCSLDGIVFHNDVRVDYP